MHRHANPRRPARPATPAPCSDIGPDDRCLSVAELFFAYGLGNSLTFPFSVGATAVLNPGRPHRPRWLELVARRGADAVLRQPRLRRRLLDADIPASTFASVRATVTAGEALPAELQRRFAAPLRPSRARRHRHDRGAAHLPVQPHGRRATRHERHAGAGYEVRLVDEADGRRRSRHTGLPPGAGTVAGDRLLEPRRSDASRVPGRVAGDRRRLHPLRRRLLDVPRPQQRHDQGRGDLGVAGGGGGRPRRAPRRAGGGRRRAARPGWPGDDVAFLVARHGRTIDAATIDAHCRERMAVFKRPRQVHVVTELPKTATGKIQRFALRDRLATPS